jgi:hypothetical protein
MIRRALRLMPAIPGAVLALTLIASLVGDRGPVSPAQAQAEYEPLRERALVQLGAQLQADQFPAARDSLSSYLARHPGDAVMQYNLACLLAIAGDHDAALARLDSALTAGYRDLDRLFTDPDLTLLRDHPRLVALTDSVETALVDRMLAAEFDLVEGTWSGALPLEPAPRHLGPGPGVDRPAGSVRVRFDQQGLAFAITPPAGGLASDLTACVALPRSLAEHETDRWFEFTGSLTAPGPVPRTARHGRHERLAAAARLENDGETWTLVVPWESLRPYRPPVELLLGVNVTLRQPAAPGTPAPRWSLIPDPFAGSHTQPWRRFAPVLLDPGPDPQPAMAGRLDTYLVVADTLSAELALQGTRAAPAVTTLLLGADDTSLAPTDTLDSVLEPGLTFQTVAWNVGDLPLGWFSVGARVEPRPDTADVVDTGARPASPRFAWRDRAFRLPPDWFVEGRERAADLREAELSIVEYHLFRVLRGQQAFHPHDDPGAIAEAALTAEALLTAAEQHGTVLPPAATTVEAAFPTGSDALQACRLLLPEASRRAGAPAFMVVTSGRDETAAVAAALTAQRRPDDPRIILVLSAPVRPGEGRRAAMVVDAARTWLGSLIDPAAVHLVAAGPAAAPALNAVVRNPRPWRGLLLLAPATFDPWPAMAPETAGRQAATALDGMTVILELPDRTAPRTAALADALVGAAEVTLVTGPEGGNTGQDATAFARRILDWMGP